MSENNYCAVDIKYNDLSCYDINKLILLVKYINKSDSKEKIKFPKNFIEKYNKDPVNEKKKLRNKIEKLLENECGKDERCWIVHPLFDKFKDDMTKLRHEVFKPERPKGSDWLSNFDIGAVFNQYERKYNNFHGFVYNYHNFISKGYEYPNFEKLEKEGKTKLGYIYNTGAHWIAIYIDLVKGLIINFDSVGSYPVGDVPELLEKAKKYIIKKGIEPELIINEENFQKGNDECGMYSIIFVIKMLEDTNYNDYTKWLRKVKGGDNDEGINKLRDYFFTNFKLKNQK